MNCGRCRRPLQEGAQWCSFCGTPVAQPDPSYEATREPRDEPPQGDPYATAPLPEHTALPHPPQVITQTVTAPPAAGSAIAALVFGVFGLFGPLWLLGPLLALGFARRARREIYEADGALGGWQVARAARILAWTSLILMIVLAAVFAAVLVLAYLSDSGGLLDNRFFFTPAP